MQTKSSTSQVKVGDKKILRGLKIIHHNDHNVPGCDRLKIGNVIYKVLGTETETDGKVTIYGKVLEIYGE